MKVVDYSIFRFELYYTQMTARIQDFLNACEIGDANAIAMLIEAGVDIHAQADYGSNGFHFACAYGKANVIAMTLA